MRVSSRPFVGDVADQIAGHLPGTWTTQVEIYAHPHWQGDLLSWLWDRGEFVQAMEEQRVPYAVKLTSDTGIELLLAERNGDPAHGYLLAALAPQEFDDSYDNPYAPPGIVLPPHSGPATTAITDTYLPAYRGALHERRLDAVVTALERLRDEYDTAAAIRGTGLAGDGTALTGRARLEVNRAFAERAWHA
ncbi:hypothetical protein ACF1HJ_33295 [Streptomyces sp. NPDC013978]|uniref:hypothetical protein n=1 Tax=Streptomyces sp. NPDC013978 TaxID=3364869 RepID=UPI0036FF42EA